MNRNWKISQYCENPPRYDLSHFQDACAAYDDGEICVMALCDGAAEASLSHIGSACIAEFSANYFAEHFDTIYEAEFNVACEELIKYHQAMISNLAEVAMEKKNVQILVGRNIQLRELNKFASSVQILAVKGDQAIYFKVGNGSAVITSQNTVMTLSDSVKRDPSVYVTTPNPVNLLISCDFKAFTLSPSCYAIALATDGIEFEGGLFYGHAATPFYEKMLEDLADCGDDAATELQNIANALLSDNMNALKDNVGISIMYRERIVEAPAVSLAEEPVAEIVDEPAEEEVEVEIVDESAEEEIEVEIVDEPVEEEIEVEIVDESAEEEIEVEIVDEPVEEEVEVEIVDEPAEEEIEVEIVDEPVEEEIEGEIVDEPVEEEIEGEIVDESAEEEIEVEIVDESAEEEIEVEIVDEPAEEEIEVEIADESEEETVGEEVEIEIIDDEDDLEIVEDLSAKNNTEAPQEKKVSRTILKFFNVSIKKK